MELSPKGVLSAETPNNIAGLVLRLDASTIDENNATVITSWMDSSGHGRNLDQYRGKPIVKFNQELDNQKVVYFDGYSQLYSTTDFYSLLDSYSIIGLVRHSGEHDQAVIASVGTDWVFGLGENKSAYWKIGSNIISHSPSSDQSWHIVTGVFDNDGHVEFWRDGFEMLNGTISINQDAKPRCFALGGEGSNQNFSQSEVADILLYDRPLNSSERHNIEDHIRLKWMSSGLKDFPLLVRLSDGQHPEYSINTFADPSMGGDLRIFDQKGKVLPYEIDEWNASSGESTVWVKVNQITPELKLFAYWGNEDNVSLPDYRTDGTVWSDYAGVWHLSDLTNASSNNFDASSNGSPELNASGVSGYAIRFDGASDYLLIDNFNAPTGSSARTIETWIKSAQTESEILGWGSSSNRWDLGWNLKAQRF